MMGEESVAQVFLGIVVCAAWLCLLIEKKPYAAKWDNTIAILLAALAPYDGIGQALKLYELTPSRTRTSAPASAVMVSVSIECVLVGQGSVVLGTPWLRGRIVTRLTAWQNSKDDKKQGRRQIGPVTASLPSATEKLGAGSEEENCSTLKDGLMGKKHNTAAAGWKSGRRGVVINKPNSSSVIKKNIYKVEYI